MKLLIAGDLHLGRTLSDLPEKQARDHAPSAAWTRLIDSAIDLEVDALLLTGDVVDKDRVFFEAFGLLEMGIRRLGNAGIQAIAVAGNHDTRALPQLADALNAPDTFRVLGKDGIWESITLAGENEETTTIVGWSFPDTHHPESPLADAPSLPSGANVIGLLHADLNQAASPYAPVQTVELRSTSIPLWFLGHVHVPTPIDGSGIYYTGSLQGLDRSETGGHGAILLETANAESPQKITRIPLATLRYERMGPFAPSSMHTPAEAATTLAAELTRLRQSDPTAEAIAATIEIEGPTERSSQHFRSLLAELTDSDRSLASFNFMIQRINLRLSPIIELDQIAHGNDLCARLAQMILGLTKDDGDQRPAPAALQSILEEINGTPIFSGTLEPLASHDGANLLREVAEELLHELLAQRDNTNPQLETASPR